MIAKSDYVLDKVKVLLDHYASENKEINPETLKELIYQWEFDYEMDTEYRPNILKKKQSKN